MQASIRDASPKRVTAVLGPTNTGKTHLAIERMLGHTSGMIGFPLRLLARENYERVIKVKGRNQVALVTGEEKIIPDNPRYFLCTVESMPVENPVEFLAVDEIQLCADPERGHLFTDRLLHARGISETMLLGADTMRPMIRSLIPDAEIVSRPRFSTLRYSGAKKLTRLPPRSAIVGFSADDVYSTAELIRRNRGGTAVVLGALSPRTRNAQVEMFENGEVDYLVATDAIGMGLNLNLDHVAFARLSKFDGRSNRALTDAEVGQIAGRAGRHTHDGTFGTTANLGPIDEETVAAVENHTYAPVQALAWRNRELDFGSPQALLKSLEAAPPRDELARGRDADDYQALRALARDAEIADIATSPDAVRLLWEVCQVPDFRKILSDEHARLLGAIYQALMGNAGRLSQDWVRKQLDRLDRTDGDIDALVSRIAHIRTWTYITHRGDWIADSGHWQERARAIEDRLSDALHDGLMNRFVDKRAATLVKRLADGTDLIGAVRRDGGVLVEGEEVGALHGFRFRLDRSVAGDHARPLLTAARKALSREIPARVKRLETDTDDGFALTDEGRIAWRGEHVGGLSAGASPLDPGVVVDGSDLLDGALRERIRRRLTTWAQDHLRGRLGSLFALAEAELPARARGLAYQLVEGMGLLRRRDVAQHLRALTKAERQALRRRGVHLGHESVWLPAALKPDAVRLKLLLLAVHRGIDPGALSARRELVLWPDRATDDALCRALGYRRLLPPRGGRAKRGPPVAVRVDALERLAGSLRKLGPAGTFTPTARLAAILGGDRRALATVLPALGYAHVPADRVAAFKPAADVRGGNEAGASKQHGQGRGPSRRRKPAKATEKPAKPAPRRRPAPDPDHPFAKLEELTFEE